MLSLLSRPGRRAVFPDFLGIGNHGCRQLVSPRLIRAVCAGDIGRYGYDIWILADLFENLEDFSHLVAIENAQEKQWEVAEGPDVCYLEGIPRKQPSADLHLVSIVPETHMHQGLDISALGGVSAHFERQ